MNLWLRVYCVLRRPVLGPGRIWVGTRVNEDIWALFLLIFSHSNLPTWRNAVTRYILIRPHVTEQKTEAQRLAACTGLYGRGTTSGSRPKQCDSRDPIPNSYSTPAQGGMEDSGNTTEASAENGRPWVPQREERHSNLACEWLSSTCIPKRNCGPKQGGDCLLEHLGPRPHGPPPVLLGQPGSR